MRSTYAVLQCLRKHINDKLFYRTSDWWKIICNPDGCHDNYFTLFLSLFYEEICDDEKRYCISIDQIIVMKTFSFIYGFKNDNNILSLKYWHSNYKNT